MKKSTLLWGLSSFIIILNSLNAEPSVYGFGQDSSTQTQSYAYSNKKRSTIASLRQKISEQDERIDGLTTIIEGLSAELNSIKHSGGAVSAPTDNALLKKLADMIDDINANYVSKDALAKALGKRNLSSSNETKKREGIVSIEGKSSAKLYSEGVRFFVKKAYDEAEKRFMITDTKGYKPAASNYYLGEIAYYGKKYEDAIFYFKKSAGLYDKASYIDTLLFHTAVSLEKTGDKEQARAFYENIVANYQGKKSAKFAKQRLRKL